MPSIYSLATLAFAFAALAPATLASETDIAARAMDLTDSIMAKSQLQKRRPNHADEYGYPHNLPKDKGPRKKMTPGGYKSPHPSNFGKKCRRDNQCFSQVKYGAAKCDAGVCTFRCLGDTVKQGNSCIGKFKAPTCKAHRHCYTRVKNAWAACNDGKCIFRCNHGYHSEGNKCVKNDDRCDRSHCIPVEDGFNTCVKRGHRSYCEPQCATYLGYQLYTNADGSAYKCVNTMNDPANCGKYGNTCQPGYNGKGVPVCRRGQCDLDCRGQGRRRVLPNGNPYCSSI